MRKAGITSGLVSALIKMQFPQWGGMPVRAVDVDGWDNATFRLGESMSVRLPSAEEYVAAVAYDGETRQALDALNGHIDTVLAAEVWQAALEAAWQGRPVWFHGDVQPDNLPACRSSDLGPGTRLGDLESHEGARRRA